MKTLQILAAAAMLALASLGTAQVNMPNPQAPGNSPDSAVRIIATSDLMIDRQITRWLRQHYPGWSADPHEFTNIGSDRYAIVYISAPNQGSRRVYFRIMRNQNEDESFPSF